MQDSQTMAHFLCGIGCPHVGALVFEGKYVRPPGGFVIPKRKRVSPRGDLQFPNGNTLVPGGFFNFQTKTR